MAQNIFSGLFNQGNANRTDAFKLAKYKQELEDYGDENELYKNRTSLEKLGPLMDSAMQDMTPERQRIVQMQRGMIQDPVSGPSADAFHKSFSQRGMTIADMLKQKQALENAKAKQMHKVENPTAESVNKKIEQAIAYIGQDEWDRLNASEDPADRVKLRGLMRDSWRDRQLVDTGTGFKDVFSTGDQDTISKNLIQAGVSKALVPDMSDRLINFYKNIDNTEVGLDAIQTQRGEIKLLHDTAPGSTGWNKFLNILPGSKQMTWEQRRDAIVANIGLDKILDLKASSAQGATGLGALNEKELEMLQKHKGSLEQAQDFKEVQRILKSLDEGMAKASLRMRRELMTERDWYKKNQYLAGHAPDAELNIFDDQQRLFSLGEYEASAPLSTLGAETDDEDLVGKWSN